jgi:acetyltransferase-like isoleucine patch superfamily enzyme
MILTKEHIEILNSYGLNFDGVNRNIPDDFTCELPCSLKRTEIGPHVRVGAFSYMVSGYLFATKIGRYCSIGEDVQIGRQNHPIDWVSTSPYFYLKGEEIQPIEKAMIRRLVRNTPYSGDVQPTKLQKTIIGNDVWIGHGAILKAGISVGDGAIIAAGAVVTKDVEPYSIVGGNPAKFIRYRIDQSLIEPLMKIQWWDYTPKQLEKFSMHDIANFILEFNQSNISKKEMQTLHINTFNFKKWRLQ